MRFLIITACLAAFVAFVITQECDKDDDPETVCNLIVCNGNNTRKSCEKNECTCVINTNIACSSVDECQVLPLSECKVEGHDGGHHHHPPHGHGDDVAWHCLDSKCSCF